jgi:U3 small nucleolar RNA-associated protein 18
LHDLGQLQGSYRSIDFHPLDSYVMLSKRESIRLYHLDERSFKRVKTIKFDDFMIEQATIRPNGQELFLSASRKTGRIYYYDFLSDKLMKLPLRRGSESIQFRQFSFSPDDRLVCGTGQNQLVHILDANSKEIMFNLKINSESVATCFSPDSSKVFVHSGEGKVYVFDIRQNGRCLHRFVDEGCIQGTALTISPNDQYFACGSESGIVNVYDYQSVLKNREPKPIKTVTHLLTAVNRIRFNHSTEIMSISSDQIDNAVKCLHLPSFNAFADFPRLKTNYGAVTDVAFSPNSYYYAFANEAGKSHLLRLLSFDKY